MSIDREKGVEICEKDTTMLDRYNQINTDIELPALHRLLGDIDKK